MGWIATALVGAQTLLFIRDYNPAVPLYLAVIRAPAFWLVLILTISIALPWTNLRPVPVSSTVLSKHALKMDFDCGTPVPESFTRISPAPL